MGSAVVPLPLVSGEGMLAYDHLFRPAEGLGSPLDEVSLGLFFELTLGLSAWKEHGSSRWALRNNPSSGGGPGAGHHRPEPEGRRAAAALRAVDDLRSEPRPPAADRRESAAAGGHGGAASNYSGRYIAGRGGFYRPRQVEIHHWWKGACRRLPGHFRRLVIIRTYGCRRRLRSVTASGRTLPIPADNGRGPTIALL